MIRKTRLRKLFRSVRSVACARSAGLAQEQDGGSGKGEAGDFSGAETFFHDGPGNQSCNKKTHLGNWNDNAGLSDGQGFGEEEDDAANEQAAEDAVRHILAGQSD